jgi:hypothetical protein
MKSSIPHENKSANSDISPGKKSVKHEKDNNLNQNKDLNKEITDNNKTKDVSFYFIY